MTQIVSEQQTKNNSFFTVHFSRGHDAKENKSSSTEMGIKASSAAKFTAKVPQI